MAQCVQYKIGKSDGQFRNEKILQYPPMDDACRFVSDATLSSVWKDDCARRKDLAMMWVTGLVGTVLCSDHTFWNTKVTASSLSLSL